MLHRRCSILPVGVTPWIRMDLLPMNCWACEARPHPTLRPTLSNKSKATWWSWRSWCQKYTLSYLTTHCMTILYVWLMLAHAFWTAECWNAVWGRESVSSASLGFDDLDDFCAPASLKDRDTKSLSQQKTTMDFFRKGPVATNGMHIYPGLSMLSLHFAFCSHQTIIGLSCASNISNASEQWSAWRTTYWSLADWKSSVGVPLPLCTGNRATDWLVEEVGGILWDIFRNSLDRLSSQHRCKQCKHLCEASPQSNVLIYVILCNINIKFG